MDRKVFSIAGALLCMFSASAFAHPPAKVEVVAHKKKVEIKAVHAVTDPKTHFVKQVEVFRNGDSVAVEDLHGQTNAMQQTATVKVPKLKKGDVIEVKARCNKGGERSGKTTFS